MDAAKELSARKTGLKALEELQTALEDQLKKQPATPEEENLASQDRRLLRSVKQGIEDFQARIAALRKK